MLKELISGSSISFGRRAFFCFFGRFHQSLCQKPSLLLFSRTVTNHCWSRKSSHFPTLHESLILVMCYSLHRHVSRSYFGNLVRNFDCYRILDSLRSRTKSYCDFTIKCKVTTVGLEQPMFCVPIPSPRTRQRETSDISPRNKGGNVHVFGSSRSLHLSAFTSRTTNPLRTVQRLV